MTVTALVSVKVGPRQMDENEQDVMYTSEGLLEGATDGMLLDENGGEEDGPKLGAYEGPYDGAYEGAYDGVGGEHATVVAVKVIPGPTTKSSEKSCTTSGAPQSPT